MKHAFHTRHDFTPELGWAAFQLLVGFGEAGADPDELGAAAREMASPLARRADLRKLLSSLEELGLTRRDRDRVVLSRGGRALAAAAGRSEVGFCAGVHCLYAWRWLWGGSRKLAMPSWSYRQVCREIRLAGSLGVEPDAIVLKVVAAGARFDAEAVSFSRSSVGGVVSWLKSQVPPLACDASARVRAIDKPRPGLTLVRYQVAALCSLHGGDALVEGDAADQLADALVVSPQELRASLEGLADAGEFAVAGSRVAYRESSDPFLEWIAHGRFDDI